MRLLLDTHTFIWYVTDNPKLSPTVRTLIDDGNNETLLSIASIWEMAIKQSIGKLSFGMPFRMFIEQQVSLNRIDILDINLDYIEVIATLPLHHRDPFDRLIIAQAMVEQIPILSADSAFDVYPIQRLW
ncbi:type II toxin-antitoxin system VapC family toxin [Argonema antarcticum]|uniref:type II toxin-antitoxin system VapC family toxin n=1 Tax=Argonema antarcticum TaxID=2942763 RepID=UPI002012A042|nr:type II toxin-antitoxin system VapC family toxin [Argonema antarcticum]MCL1472290.1 type II toxin-antitoxin system VapC family toxin [Argonema antarcticum A004/B2]